MFFNKIDRQITIFGVQHESYDCLSLRIIFFLPAFCQKESLVEFNIRIKHLNCKICALIFQLIYAGSRRSSVHYTNQNDLLFESFGRINKCIKIGSTIFGWVSLRLNWINDTEPLIYYWIYQWKNIFKAVTTLLF